MIIQVFPRVVTGGRNVRQEYKNNYMSVVRYDIIRTHSQLLINLLNLVPQSVGVQNWPLFKRVKLEG